MRNHQIISVPIVLTEPFYLSHETLEEFARLGGYVMVDALNSGDLASKIPVSPDVRIIVTEYVQINEVSLRQFPGLQGVITYGAGYDHIDAALLKREGIMLCNCPGENSTAVAELVFGLLLCLLRRIHWADQFVRVGEWTKADRALPSWASGRELWQKTLGVIGLGQIGSRVARIAKGFDMNVIGYNPRLNSDLYGRRGVKPVDLPELLSRSDVVTIHVPLTAETERMIDAQALSKARPGMVLVNTSRGKVIHEEALIDALQDGRIGGAALDVFTDEPLPPGHPLTLMDNVILSPHLGALTQEAGDRLSGAVARQVRDILMGRIPEGLILGC